MGLSRDKKSIIILGSMAFILLAAVIVIFISLRTNPVHEEMKGQELMKVLFVIYDENDEALNTDVMLYNPKNNKCTLFSIPGNVGAIYQVIGRTDRIDAVYAEKGIETYKSEIESLLDIDIPFTIEMSLEQLGRLTDLFGGIGVFIPSPVNCSSESGEKWLLPGGAVTLDGDKMRTYMMYSIPDEDSDEQEDRRQNIFIALLTAFKDNRTLMLEEKNFPQFSVNMRANVDEEGLYTILEYISNIETDSLAPRTVAGLTRYVDGKELLFPMYSGDLIKEVVAQASATVLSDDESSLSNGYAVEVQNGTDVMKLALRTGNILKSAGYDVIQTVNADRDDYEHTMIINHGGSGSSDAARTLANFLLCNYIVDEPFSIQSESGAEVDFTIILGADFDGRYVRGNYTPPQQAEEIEEYSEY